MLHFKKLSKFGYTLLTGISAAALFILLLAALIEDLLSNQLAFFDNMIGQTIIGWASPTITLMMKTITMLGSAMVVIGIGLVSAGYFWYAGKKRATAGLIVINLAGAWLLNYLMKISFHRARPQLHHLVAAGGFSFPSGHAMVSLVCYGLLAYLCWLNLPRRWYKYLLVLVFAVLPFLIGVSRIYLGVHYASDVIAGFAAGGLWLTSCILGAEIIYYYQQKR